MITKPKKVKVNRNHNKRKTPKISARQDNLGIRRLQKLRLEFFNRKDICV